MMASSWLATIAYVCTSGCCCYWKKTTEIFSYGDGFAIFNVIILFTTFSYMDERWKLRRYHTHMVKRLSESDEKFFRLFWSRRPESECLELRESQNKIQQPRKKRKKVKILPLARAICLGLIPAAALKFENEERGISFDDFFNIPFRLPRITVAKLCYQRRSRISRIDPNFLPVSTKMLCFSVTTGKYIK